MEVDSANPRSTMQKSLKSSKLESPSNSERLGLSRLRFKSGQPHLTLLGKVLTEKSEVFDGFGTSNRRMASLRAFSQVFEMLRPISLAFSTTSFIEL